MIAKITTGNNLYGALAYNQEKVDAGKGAVLGTHIICEPQDGRFTASQTSEEIQRFIPSHYRTEKPVVHVSLNPDSKDNLPDYKLLDIATDYMQGMGWGEQPYIVFKHTDIERVHIHVVSIQVRPDGRKIDDSNRNRRSVAITEEIEKKYNLHPAKEQRSTTLRQLMPIDPNAGNLKKQIAAVVKTAVDRYRFQTLGEWRALLSFYGIGVEEIEGERRGQPYCGVLYTALDKDGERISTRVAIKSSLMDRSVGFAGLERRMEQSARRIDTDKSREQARRTIEKALGKNPTEDQLRELLRTEGIDLFMRRNAAGRITGVTFIDHRSRTVLNGSRLGKEYSANAFERRFKAENSSAEQSPTTAKKQPSRAAEPNIKVKR